MCVVEGYGGEWICYCLEDVLEDVGIFIFIDIFFKLRVIFVDLFYLKKKYKKKY